MLFTTACLGLAVFVPAGMAQTARQKVVAKAYYALDTAANGTSSQTLSGNYVGDWDLLDSDYTSYNTVKGWYGCNSSDWAVSGDGSGCADTEPYVSFYSNPSGYGYSTIGVPYADFGRGGQCTYFVNLVVYRSGVDTSSFPTLATMHAAGTSISAVQVGDVIQRYNVTGLTNHVAIVVAVYTSGGSVTSVDVVDSDWVSESGAANHEIIARHNFTAATLANFTIWKVPGY